MGGTLLSFWGRGGHPAVVLAGGGGPCCRSSGVWGAACVCRGGGGSRLWLGWGLAVGVGHAGHIRKMPKRAVPAGSGGRAALASITARQRPRTDRVSRGSITPSSYIRPDRKNACDSASICSSTAARIAASASSSKAWPRAAADWPPTIASTPASPPRPTPPHSAPPPPP